MDQNNERPKKKVGLALSGGFIRATASIGVIEVLRENNIPIDMIAGCSAGAGVATAYTAGSLPKIKDRLANGTKKEYWQIIFEPTIPRKGFLKSNRNKEFFKEFVGEKDFSQLNRPTFLVATDIKSLEPVIINEGKVYEAIQASMGVAGIWEPIKYGDKVLVDGGNFNLIPSKPLYDNGADYVIAVDSSQSPNIFIKFFSIIHKIYKKIFRIKHSEVVFPKNILSKDPNFIRLVIRAIKLSSTKIENFHHSAYSYDILIKPKVSEYKRWDVGRVHDIIAQGRKAAEEALPQIKKDLGL